MKLSVWFLLAIFSFSAQALAVDEPPSTPIGLTATVYSDTAGGIRWLRSTDDMGVVVGYEVTRDGQILGVYDSLSIVEFDLSPETVYVYGVTAIDSAGQRSETSTVTLSTVFAVTELTPTGLTTAVYSETAAELFWDRNATQVLQYEVRRDGQVLGVTDGVSWFDDTLSAGTWYIYEVFSIDEAGRLSEEPATLDLGTPGSVLDAPVNLSVEVYSSTAVELFWDRSDTPGSQYEVSRDSVILDTIDGTSWFDDSLAAETNYTFEVVAIDSYGERSQPSSISVTTNPGANTNEPVLSENPFTEADPNAETVIAKLGYPAVRDLADDLVSMSYLSLYYDNESDLLSVWSGEAYYEEFEIDCPQGGSVSGLKTPPGSFAGELDACAFNGITLSGTYERLAEITVFGLGDNRTYTVSFDNVTIDAGDEGTLEITGSSQRLGGTFAVSNCGGAPTVTSSTTNEISYAVWEGAEEVTTISNASWQQTDISTPTLDGDVYTSTSTCSIVDTLTFNGESTHMFDLIGDQTAVITK